MRREKSSQQMILERLDVRGTKNESQLILYTTQKNSVKMDHKPKDVS